MGGFRGVVIVRVDDLRNETAYFTGPTPTSASHAKLLPCTLPAAWHHDELVSAGFQGKEIWLYSVPGDLDAVLDASIAPSEGSLSPTASPATTAARRSRVCIIEVFSLNPGAIAADRCVVKCDAVGALTFSFDGILILDLGTRVQSAHPNTVSHPRGPMEIDID